MRSVDVDLTAESLLIEGQNVLWNNDSDLAVTPAGTPLFVLRGAMHAHVLATGRPAPRSPARPQKP